MKHTISLFSKIWKANEVRSENSNPCRAKQSHPAGQFPCRPRLGGSLPWAASHFLIYLCDKRNRSPPFTLPPPKLETRAMICIHVWASVVSGEDTHFPLSRENYHKDIQGWRGVIRESPECACMLISLFRPRSSCVHSGEGCRGSAKDPRHPRGSYRLPGHPPSIHLCSFPSNSVKIKCKVQQIPPDLLPGCLSALIFSTLSLTHLTCRQAGLWAVSPGRERTWYFLT